MRNDVLRSDLRGASVVTTPGRPGGERAHVTSTMGQRRPGRGQISRHSEPLSYTTLIDEWPLWCDDPQNRSKWEHGNRISIYLFLRTYSRVTSNWVWKGFIPVWQRQPFPFIYAETDFRQTGSAMTSLCVRDRPGQVWARFRSLWMQICFINISAIVSCLLSLNWNWIPTLRDSWANLYLQRFLLRFNLVQLENAKLL